MLKTLSIAAIIAVTASASFAGSLAQTAPEPQVQDDGAFVPVVGSGIGAPAIVGGVLAAAAVGALIANSNEEETTTEVRED